MVNRLKYIVEHTPKHDQLFNDDNKEKLSDLYTNMYRKALSKAMMLMKMKQYVEDISEVVTLPKEGEEFSKDDTLPEYYSELFDKKKLTILFVI